MSVLLHIILILGCWICEDIGQGSCKHNEHSNCSNSTQKYNHLIWQLAIDGTMDKTVDNVLVLRTVLMHSVVIQL